MKKTTIFLAVLLALLFSVSAFAQMDDGPYNKDYDIGGGGGDSACKTCATIASNYVLCTSTVIDWDGPLYGRYYSGWQNCTAYNPPGGVGPAICVMSGNCIGNAGASYHSPSSAAEEQSAAIDSFLRSSGVIPACTAKECPALDDFIAETDYAIRDEPFAVAAQHRLDAYRDKFATLMGFSLRPGGIPVMPHKPNKAPAATVAAR